MRTQRKFIIPTAPGDIHDEQTATLLNSQATFANIAGCAFANGTVRSFTLDLTALITATANLYEHFRIKGVQIGADWDYSIESLGDDSLVELEVTTAGQVRYKSSTYAGFTAAKFQFRATTTSV